MKSDTKASRRSIRRHLFAGVAVAALLAGGVGGWASATEFAGAVIASGSVVVDSNIKKVQHLTGGIVGELRVHDGDRVSVGDVVVRLDDTVTRANLAIVKKGLDELVGRKARLESERDARQTIKFPDELLARKGDPEVAHVMGSESKLFELRRSARQGQKAQFRERIDQLQEEARGLVAQQAAKDQELGLIGRELAGVKELWAKNLIQHTRLTALEREQARLQGERGQLIAGAAQIKGKIAETELQIIQLDQDLSSDVAKETREIEAKIGEFVERKVTAEDQLKRIEIRAPQDGTVFQLAVHTVGGVVAPGDTIMLIVPNADNLIVEAKVNPQDIDSAAARTEGQVAILCVQPALNTGDRGSPHPHLGRYHSRSTHRAELLRDPGRHVARGSRSARRSQTAARYAGRGLRPDGRAHRPVLFDEAAARPVHADVSREMS